MMRHADHTKLTVSLLGEKNKLQKSMYKYYANCVCVCVHIYMHMMFVYK